MINENPDIEGQEESVEIRFDKSNFEKLLKKK